MSKVSVETACGQMGKSRAHEPHRKRAPPAGHQVAVGGLRALPGLFTGRLAAGSFAELLNKVKTMKVTQATTSDKPLLLRAPACNDHLGDLGAWVGCRRLRA